MNRHPLHPSTEWKWGKIALAHSWALFSLFTLFSPATRPYWEALDRAFFHLVHPHLFSPFWAKVFWAISNHRWMDWVGDSVMAGYFLWYIFSLPRADSEGRRKRTAEFLFAIAYVAITALLINQLLFRYCLSVSRLSPTLALPEAVRLSQQIDWIGIKDASKTSFPGDHAMTALSIALSTLFFVGWRKGAFLIAYTLYIWSPRLVLGAHWLSDLLVGSLSCGLVPFAWVFGTPLHRKGVEFFMGCLRGRRSRGDGRARGIRERLPPLWRGGRSDRRAPSVQSPPPNRPPRPPSPH